MILENKDIQDATLRPLVGLLADTSEPIKERLTINAMKQHRALVATAEELFQNLPENVGSETEASIDAHVAYLEATIAMHAQMSALTSLLAILGRVPTV
ncbi:transcriptional repressor TraM [Neorhizobium sp. NCHU2750]|uniref:transcriptional repressor TraM n=1 Tax=Neorhizobium sp. NCHU2750 TaxID=1825976 RepID=UPI000E75E44A|nr:TraR antiactivator [Neorhizobium sp. NCHU2750]